jgi:S-adenosylmethionine:tRNA ribosyltransferase-isomerase
LNQQDTTFGDRRDALRVADFDYELPPELIAQHPLADRDASRLMVVRPDTQTIVHKQFRDIVDELAAGDLLVFNNSKVLPARLYGVKKDTGARIEFLLTKRLSTYEWEAMARPAKRLKEGSQVVFQTETGDELGQAEVLGAREDGLRVLRFTLGGFCAGHTISGLETGLDPDFNEMSSTPSVRSAISPASSLTMEEFLHQIGQMPLPPYIHQPLKEKNRYQTVYASPEGSVAAPTAGLHFTEFLLETLRERGVELQFVTLHVGLGTFRPVSVDKVEDHHMHSETYQVDASVAESINQAKSEGRRVIAVGTTALRTLESAQTGGVVQAGSGDTDIFIYPGYQFQVIDGLITNFHLPKSTLLMLVSALMGTEFTRQVYAEAVRKRYRFFSFGDAMFITGSAVTK